MKTGGTPELSTAYDRDIVPDLSGRKLGRTNTAFGETSHWPSGYGLPAKSVKTGYFFFSSAKKAF